MKSLVVYVHLLAACLAVGTVIVQDFALAKSGGKPLSLLKIKQLKQAAALISQALVVLWISGLTLVFLGYNDDPQQYLMNPKLWAKFTVVAVLTLNGIVLHYYSFPRVASSRSIVRLSGIEKLLVVLTGAVSGISWLFACYLGIARAWNYTVGYGFVMYVYLGLLAPACFFSCVLIYLLGTNRFLTLTQPRLATANQKPSVNPHQKPIVPYHRATSRQKPTAANQRPIPVKQESTTLGQRPVTLKQKQHAANEQTAVPNPRLAAIEQSSGQKPAAANRPLVNQRPAAANPCPAVTSGREEQTMLGNVMALRESVSKN